MLEPGIPAVTLQQLGISRTELEGASGKTVLIYVGEKMTIVVPDMIDFTSKDINAKIQDLTAKARNIDIECDTVHIKASKIKIEADVEIIGNLDAHGGIIRLN